MLLRLAATALAVLALAACGGSKQAAAPASGLPVGCSVAEVHDIVTAFVTHPTLAPVAMFLVYGTYESDGGRFVTHKRAAALARLRARQAAGEKLRLLSLRVAPEDVNHVRITVELTRFAPDFAQRNLLGRIANGAGVIDCAHQKVAAWIIKGP